MGFAERWFDVSHVYTSLADWHFLNALGQRPIVLTITQGGMPADPKLLGKVARVVAETDRLAAEALRLGVPSDRISVAYPGVDLQLFSEVPVPPIPWKCVFASSPENTDEIRTKGVDLLLEAARVRSDIEFTLLWRPFGRAADIALDEVRRIAPPNIVIVKQRVADMHKFLPKYHFAIAPFRTVGKPCPNSILESLAVGRPSLVSEFVDIGDVLEKEHAGIVFARTVDGLCNSLDTLCRNYVDYQQNARACAVRHFDFQQTKETYRNLYHSVVDQ